MEHSERTPEPLVVSKSGVLVIGGFAPRLFVQAGHLVADGSFGRDQRRSRFHRATSGLKRVVVIGRSGSISLSAYVLLADAGIPLVVLHPDGRPLATSAGYGLSDGRLRLAQGAAWGTETALSLARFLLARKLDDQVRIVAKLPGGEDAAATIERLSATLADAPSVEALMLIEASAAVPYANIWATLPVPWARADLAKMPQHWLTVGTRSSPLTSSPRLAVTPVQAVRNYLLGIVESEARLACLAQGLDPAIPCLHSPQKARDGLVCDVQEAVRGGVDEFILNMLQREVWRRRDFHQGARGEVRLLPPLSHRFAETGPLWARCLGPVVEQVAAAFAGTPGSRIDRLPTKLTEANRSAGRDGLRRGPRHRPGVQVARRPACVECGEPTPGTDRRVCDACLPQVIGEQRTGFLAAGYAELTRQRNAGTDPSHGGDVGLRRGAKIAASRRAATEWEQSNGPAGDLEVYRREVWPLLAGVSPARLAELTGLSRPYCAAILRGERVPHPRWWTRLTSDPDKSELPI